LLVEGAILCKLAYVGSNVKFIPVATQVAADVLPGDPKDVWLLRAYRRWTALAKDEERRMVERVMKIRIRISWSILKNLDLR
tara:strand:- start:253 stop:498 length:246 start_codon:yes stop_codon:yes gene_type:complete